MKNRLKNTVKKKFDSSKINLIEQPFSIFKKINIENLTKITSLSLTEKYKKFKKKLNKKSKIGLNY